MTPEEVRTLLAAQLRHNIRRPDVDETPLSDDEVLHLVSAVLQPISTTTESHHHDH